MVIPSESESRKLVEGLREVVKGKGYNDDDIFSMLEECNMDPDETAQRLLSQDPFHEVKRKRDKKKENANNQNASDFRGRSSNQSRGGRGGTMMGHGVVRASYRPISQDGSSFKGNNARENGGIYKPVIRNANSQAYPSENVLPRPSSTGTSSLPVVANGDPGAIDVPASNHGPNASKEDQHIATGQSEKEEASKGSGLQQESVQHSIPSYATAVAAASVPSTARFPQTIALTPISSSGVSSLIPDPVYVPSADSRASGVVGTIKRAVGTVGARVTDSSLSLSSAETLQSSQWSLESVAKSDIKSTLSDGSVVNHVRDSQDGNKFLSSHGDNVYDPKVQENISPVMEKPHVSRPQQQPVGTQKGTGNMEWKRKTVNQSSAFSNAAAVADNTENGSVNENYTSVPAPTVSNADENITRTEEKIDQHKVSRDQGIIMPESIKAAEVACLGLCFGSFGLNKDLGKGGFENSCSPSDSSQRTEESTEEPSTRISEEALESPSEDQEEASPSGTNPLHSSVEVKESVTPAGVSHSEPSKQDPVVQMQSQYRVVESAPNYATVGLMPQIMGTQYPPYEPALSGALEAAARQSNIVMQQHYDPSTNFTFLRPGDGDARLSPFIGASTLGKYNANTAFLSGQSVPTSQEIVSSVAVSSTVPTAPASQMAGVAPTTVSFPQQQQMHMFPQANSLHLSPFPQTFFPYAHQYVSPLYFNPQALNNYGGNIGYAQPTTANNFPLPSGASFPSAGATAAVKFPISQYKQMAPTGNTSQAGYPVGYTSYTTPSGFASSPAANGGARSGFEENKESNMYIPNQQVDGNAFWLRTPQNIAALQSSSYYSLSPQGQNVQFPQAQSGHAAYAGGYHPAQSGVSQNSPQLLQQQSEQMAAASANNNSQSGGYQQAQQGQLNWGGNY